MYFRLLMFFLIYSISSCSTIEVKKKNLRNYKDSEILFSQLAGLVRQQSKLPDCPSGSPESWNGCFGTLISATADGYKYVGEFGNGPKMSSDFLNDKNKNKNKGKAGIGVSFVGFRNLGSDTAVVHYGQWNNNKEEGLGRTYRSDGSRFVHINLNDYSKTDGILFDATGKIIKTGGWVAQIGEHKTIYYVDPNKFKFDGALDFPTPIFNDFGRLLGYEFKNKISNKLLSNSEMLNNEKVNILESDQDRKLNLKITASKPDLNGIFEINIQANNDIASLKIDGKEETLSQSKQIIIKRVARIGKKTKLNIVVLDIFGNSHDGTVSVTREIIESNQVQYAELNPAIIKTQTNKDAVAIIIGIADYKNLPKADYANDDARIFYDYALRGLGVKAENIKLLVDGDADQIDIYKAFKTWLPSRVKSTTDIYVFYSGHGLPTDDGQGLYLLPQRADRDFIEKTAINQQEINSALQAVKPKSVTIFLDSCYSGMARTGQTLLASARPIKLKASTQAFPAEFTVISASQEDQISSSSPELKHGIFSYYLMKGMEGDADTNKDGKITVGEMHGYLSENVARQASLTNRIQQPQLSGDANRILVGK